MKRSIDNNLHRHTYRLGLWRMIFGKKVKVGDAEPSGRDFRVSFHDSASLRDVLSRMPSSWGRIVAVRAALRVLPGVDGFESMTNGPKGAQTVEALLRQTFRAVFVGWAFCVTGGFVRTEAVTRARRALKHHLDTFVAQMGKFDETCNLGSDAHIGVILARQKAAIRCSKLAFNCVEWIAFAHLEFDQHSDQYHANDAFRTVRFSGLDQWEKERAWTTTQVDAIRSDIRRLALGEWTAPEREACALAMAPLWPEPADDAIALNLFWRHMKSLRAIVKAEKYSSSGAEQFRHSLETKLPQELLYWLEERKRGQLVLGQSLETQRDRIARIANCSDSLWEMKMRDFKYAISDCFNKELDDPVWAKFEMVD